MDERQLGYPECGQSTILCSVNAPNEKRETPALFKARLHVKREGTARLETSTGSRRNLLFTRTNSVMCPTEKGTVLESPLERVLDCLHVVFFETGNDRARDN